MTLIETGDWIRIPQLWPGVWKVYRTLSGFAEERWSLDEPLQPSRRRILFCYRLVNDSRKRSFSHQSCEASFGRALSPEERERVEGLLSSDTKLARAFDKYQTSQKPIDLVANLGFGNFAEGQREEFPQICSRLLRGRIEAGITMDEV